MLNVLPLNYFMLLIFLNFYSRSTTNISNSYLTTLKLYLYKKNFYVTRLSTRVTCTQALPPSFYFIVRAKWTVCNLSHSSSNSLLSRNINLFVQNVCFSTGWKIKYFILFYDMYSSSKTGCGTDQKLSCSSSQTVCKLRYSSRLSYRKITTRKVWYNKKDKHKWTDQKLQ